MRIADQTGRHLHNDEREGVTGGADDGVVALQSLRDPLYVTLSVEAAERNYHGRIVLQAVGLVGQVTEVGALPGGLRRVCLESKYSSTLPRQRASRTPCRRTAAGPRTTDPPGTSNIQRDVEGFVAPAPRHSAGWQKTGTVRRHRTLCGQFHRRQLRRGPGRRQRSRGECRGAAKMPGTCSKSVPRGSDPPEWPAWAPGKRGTSQSTIFSPSTRARRSCPEAGCHRGGSSRAVP